MAIAATQAWVSRHFITPDGIAYLDLSDAILDGSPSSLVNGYWSPVYPLLIGVARLLLAWTPLGAPYFEFAIVHGVNLVTFAVSLACFERFLGALAADGTNPTPAFTTMSGRLVAYLFFGAVSLSMISVKAPTPDMLAAALTFAAFALMLQVRREPDDRRRGIGLGITLALAALTKSFFFPLGVLCLLTLAVACWRTSRRGIAMAAGTFVLATLPWILALSFSMGRPTTGDTGRLNYVWWVNRENAPQSGDMPASVTPREGLAVDGLAIIPDGRGTNPLWYDPVRWFRDARPRFSVSEQSQQLLEGLAFYAAIAAPLWLALIAIGAGTRWVDARATLIQSGIVVVPAVAALGAYALVYTAARYVAPFLVAGALALAASLPRGAPLRLSRVALAFGLSLLLFDALSPMRSRVFVAYGMTMFVVAWIVWRSRGVTARAILTLLTALVATWACTLLPSAVVRAIIALSSVALWIALARHETPDAPSALGPDVRRAIAIGAVLAILLPSIVDGVYALRNARPADVHPHWSAAQSAIRAGTPAGSRIALLGSPYDVGWARLARYRIVAVVPQPKVAAFLALSERDRQRIVDVFRAAGAQGFVTATAP